MSSPGLAAIGFVFFSFRVDETSSSGVNAFLLAMMSAYCRRPTVSARVLSLSTNKRNTRSLFVTMVLMN